MNLIPIHLLSAAVLILSGVSCSRSDAQSTQPMPAAPQTAGEKLDSLFTTIAEGDDAARDQTIEVLHKLLDSDDQELREIAKDYAYDIKPPLFKPVPNKKRCALLVRAIPHLIARIDGRETGSAYSILTFIQPYFPDANRETWEKWWKDKGQAKYAAMAREV